MKTKKISYSNVKETRKTFEASTEEKRFPPLNGSAIQQTESAEQIARKIERYLNSCNLCLRVEEAEKFASFDKMTLGDVIWTLADAPNKASEIVKYFKQQLKIKVEKL